jgi:hypothetical protein
VRRLRLPHAPIVLASLLTFLLLTGQHARRTADPLCPDFAVESGAAALGLSFDGAATLGSPVFDVYSGTAAHPVAVAEAHAATAEVRPLAVRAESDLAEFALGELTVRVGRSSWRLAVLDPRGRLLWEESALELGGRHGPLGFKLHDGSWRHLSRLVDAGFDPDGIDLTAATDDPGGRLATVRLTSLGPRSFRLHLALTDPDEIVALGQAVPSPADERLLGFGERFTAVDQRGQVVTTWADDRRMAGYGNTTYAPLPFFISSRGYSLALETDVRSSFDLAVERPDRYAWEAETNELSLVFSYGPSPRDLVQQHVARTGLPPLPPIWAFGVWKTAIGGQQQVLRDAARLRAGRADLGPLRLRHGRRRGEHRLAGHDLPHQTNRTLRRPARPDRPPARTGVQGADLSERPLPAAGGES